MAGYPASYKDTGRYMNRVEAGILVVRRFRGSEQRLLPVTLPSRITAARRKRATLERSGRIRRASRNSRQWRVRGGLDLRDRPEQRLGVGQTPFLEQRP